MSHGRYVTDKFVSCFRNLPTPSIEGKLSVTLYLWCGHTMKKTKQKKNSQLLSEVLSSVVCEKSDLVWTIPYKKELHLKILKELFQEFPISVN